MQHPLIGAAGQSSGTNPSLLPGFAGRNEGGPAESFATVLERNAQAPEPPASPPPQEPSGRRQESAGDRSTLPAQPERPSEHKGNSESHPVSRTRPEAGSQHSRSVPDQQAGEPADPEAVDSAVASDAGILIAAEADLISSEPFPGTGEDAPHLPASLAAIASIIAALRHHTATTDGTVDLDMETEGLSRKDLSAHLASAQGNTGKGDRYLPFMSGGNGDPASLPGQQKPDPALQLLALSAQTSRFALSPAQPAQTLQAEMPLPAMGPGAFGALRSEASPIPQLAVPTPAGQRMWAEDVGSRLIWMVGRGESKAELVLTPPNLGKLGISIQVNGDQTTAQFVAANQAAREALEQAMPRLREVLQQAGINLGQTDVSTSGEHQARGDSEPGSRAGADRNGNGETIDAVATTGTWSRSGTGMIDTFA